ncbi:gas vesicle protein [Streptomyces palmae]|uniref:Gas vesicle protein n=1 Tax=Streptomyces palmae TaxID=1701085 RepID=A0A4Z0HE19_9ACTN|nr:gas vesicle protein [Streptomyces palmae]TGB19375.1 gas vesicle protein [Streptomyces palmae]
MTRHAAGAEPGDRPLVQPQVALIDLLDRLLSGGAVLTGDLILSIADIDLVRVSLRAVVVAIREEAERTWTLELPTSSAEDGADRAEPY